MKERVSIVTLSLALPSSPKKKKKKNVKGEKKCHKEIPPEVIKKKKKTPKKRERTHAEQQGRTINDLLFAVLHPIVFDTDMQRCVRSTA